MLHTVPAALTAGTAPPVYKIRIYYIELCRKFKQKQTSFPKKFYTSFTQGFPLSVHRLSTASSAPCSIGKAAAAYAVTASKKWFLRSEGGYMVCYQVNVGSKNHERNMCTSPNNDDKGAAQYSTTGVPVSALLNINSAAGYGMLTHPWDPDV